MHRLTFDFSGWKFRHRQSSLARFFFSHFTILLNSRARLSCNIALDPKMHFSCTHEAYFLVQRAIFVQHSRVSDVVQHKTIKIENSSHESWIKFNADFDFELIASDNFSIVISRGAKRIIARDTTKACRNCFVAFFTPTTTARSAARRGTVRNSRRKTNHFDKWTLSGV